MSKLSQLGYKFKDEKLLERALTHSSKSEQNYERLEFLGDSILDFVVGDYLFKHSRQSEGALTVTRAHFVSENYLSQIFDELKLESEVMLGKSFQGKISKSIKGDVLEAIIAAIYLDSDLVTVTKIIEKTLKLDTFDKVKNDNFKSQLQELVQASFKCKMQYQTEPCEDGFSSTFYMDEDAIETGHGVSKLEAEQDAAHKSIKKLFLVED